MATETGIGGLGDLVNRVIDFSLEKRRLDLESRGDDRNMPDRIDVRSGYARGGVGGGNAGTQLATWQWVGIGVAAALVIGFVARKLA